MDPLTSRLEVQALGKTLQCEDGDVIGRKGSVGQDLFADLPEFADRHLIIGQDARSWFLLIPKSVKEPVLLDGEPAEPGLRLPLENSHLVRVGKTTLHFKVIDETARTEAMMPVKAEEEPPTQPAILPLDGKFFEMLVENVHDLIAILNAHGRRLWHNAAYAAVLGYTPEELKGSDFTVEIHPDDRPLVQTALQEAIRTGRGRRLEYRMRHREGRWIFLESKGVVLPNWPGVGTCLLTIARDVTARKRAEYDMRKRQRRRREQSEVLGKFATDRELRAGNLPVCLAMLTEALAETLHCERAAVWLVNKEAGRLMCADSFIHGENAHATGEDSLALAEIPHYLQSLRAIRSLIAPQALDHPALREWSAAYLQPNQIVAKLDVPLFRGEELLGVLCCESTHQHEWTVDEENFATSLADLFLLAHETQERQRTGEALREGQKKLTAETAEAARYVLSLFPAKLTGAISTDWLFIPSAQLGGDALGYHWLDDTHLAVYLLDVVGEGIGAALHSVTALNVFRNQSLPNVDFREPAAVLAAVNASFEKDERNEMYFTAWYGVFHRPTRTLRYSTAGHPPAILFTGDSPTAATKVELRAPGLMIGAVAESHYATKQVTIGAFGRLYVFSDGAYEVCRRDGSAFRFEEFIGVLTNPPTSAAGELNAIVDHMREVQGAELLPDDCALLKLVFH
ncbi:putative PAS/PAC sensor protein [Chthoniobacter flavus Ellin428]|uniref:Putative PAS/PAC sensor protein n=1 Tax=Chthoniobacter flavus Ellin428 TaxID=497964 RepID=B4D1H1_9BACT|nr:SpoIIE family protein phosphatase [Chthoniobacter flavus]EDY19583.1 putative PAS/PAC sensor protein [Chthoniobacter flavus Ellin428]TCO92825.1 PAS domain S-box-containing protein [Chthoniobacter flavus]